MILSAKTKGLVFSSLVFAGCATKDECTLAKSAAAPVLEQLDPCYAIDQAPERFKVRFTTTQGDFLVEVRRAWAPLGAKRFYNLVKMRFFHDVAFFRVLPGFVVQFGIYGDPQVTAKWRTAALEDDPVSQSNQRGYVTFATSGPDTRTTQVLIHIGDNGKLDEDGYAPIGRVIQGMEVVDRFFCGYGECAPNGTGPALKRIMAEGNKYLAEGFPKLDYVKDAVLVE